MTDYTYKGKDRHFLDILRHPKLSRKQARENALHKRVNAGTGRRLTAKEQRAKTEDWPK